MKKIYLFLITVMLTMCFTSCSGISDLTEEAAGDIFADDKVAGNEIDIEQQNIENDDVNTYADSDENLSFQYPDDWSEMSIAGTIVCIAAPAESDFAANMNIVKTAVDDTFTATKADFQDYYGQMFEDVEVTEWADTKIDGTAAKKLVYTCTDYGFELAQVQYFYAVADDMYAVTFTSLQSNYDAYEPIFDSIMASYKIND